MNIKVVQDRIVAQLKTVYDEGESINIALLMLEDCTGFSRTEIGLNKETALAPEQEEKLEGHLKRLLGHEPVQYVMNKAWFYGMELYVDNNVLVPRPETEELVDWVVKDIKATGKNVFLKTTAEADQTTQLKILDIGTGSGCMALALKKAMPKAEVWGCDVSEEALNVARRNGAALNIRVDFQGLNFLDETQQRFLPTVDVIVSNPPYIPFSEKETMSANVVEHEPHNALFVPDDDALLFYKAILHFSRKRLYEEGSIFLEVHENLANEVAKLFEAEGFAVVVKKDMQGKQRMVRAAPPAFPEGR